MPLAPGDLVERYRIVASLGAGGMGEVYEAYDTRLERRVALKLLRTPTTDSGSEGSSRILREARAAAALEHPNVIAVYDVGETKDERGAPAAYLAMELVRGRTMRAFIGDESVDIAQRVAWLADVARALAAAHERGLVHRDIKPENVMIRDDGTVKVLDFGIAKRSSRIVDPSSPTEGTSLATVTAAGVVVGTPVYMAPEQMRGEALDGRADQFAWGVVAHELLAGSLPWRIDGDALQLVADVLSKEAPPLPDDVPAHVARTVDRALAKSPAARFAAMSDVLASLAGRPDSLAPTEPHIPLSRQVPATRVSERARRDPAIPKNRRVRRWSFVAAALCVACATAAIAWKLRGGASRDGRADVHRPTPRECENNAACARSHAGVPHLCRTDVGSCVALASEDCKVLADARAIERDDTVWFGTMYPLTGEDAAVYGVREAEAVDLARRDFAESVGMLASPGGKPMARSIGVVSCDDAADPHRAARHLVERLRVPAVIGFHTSTELVELASTLFTPRGVLAVAALNTSPLVTRLPQPAGQPRLVWRTTYNSAATAGPLSAFIADVLEPQYRLARAPMPFRVALVRPKAPGAFAFSDALFRVLSFNGKSALENGSDYREFVFEDPPSAADYAPVEAALVAFAPHVILYIGGDALVTNVLAPLEAHWKQSYRPSYAVISVMSPAVYSFVGASADRRRRFFGVTTLTTTEMNARFVRHFNEVFHDKITRASSPNSSYDAFYLLAYATYAAGAETEAISGEILARALERLVPPGRHVEVGPSSIFDAFTALKNGEKLDLLGSTSGLDFDLATGEAPVDMVILCVGTDDHGVANESIDSGLVYDSHARRLKGKRKCP